jgi:hypothetical protein
LEKGWVNITGMVGQHKSEWWVNMVWNLQIERPFAAYEPTNRFAPVATARNNQKPFYSIPSYVQRGFGRLHFIQKVSSYI